MTSLQKQLAVIAANSHNELDLKAQKTAYAKSLLFDPAVASTQSFDFLYQLCLEGFEEMCSLDNRFLRFGRSLFSPQSRAEDRMQLTAQENKDLDDVLGDFLALASGRLLLRPALRAVEWLIRRFRIHELNTGATILAFLPYHSNPIFVTLLSILPRQLPPTFKFLHSYKSTLSNPPLNAIVQSAIHNQNFFATFNNHVLGVCRLRYQSSTLLSLWATTAAQTVDSRLSNAKSGRVTVQHEKTEEFLVQILPILNEALSLKKVPEYTISCYIIIVVLVSKVDLDDTTLDALLTAVVSSWSKETFEPGLGCAAAIAQCKEHPVIPVATVRAALRFDSLALQLINLSHYQDTQALVLGLVGGALLLDDDVSEPGVEDFCASVLEHKLVSHSNLQTMAHLTRNSHEMNRATNQSPNETMSSKAKVRLLSMMKDSTDGEVSPKPEIPTSAPLVIRNTSSFTGSGDVSSRINRLPAKLNINTFFGSVADDMFEQFAACFEIAHAAREDLQALSDLKVWAGATNRSYQLLASFYLRLLCSSSSPQAKVAAVKQLAKAVQEAPAGKLDPQSLIIICLIALQDDNRKVRQATSELAIIFAKRVEASANKLSARWQLYGSQTPELPVCQEKTMSAFVQRYLRKELEECVADKQQAQRMFEHAMRASSAQSGAESDNSKRLKSAQREELMDLVSAHIDRMPIAPAKSKLLQLIAAVDKVSGKPRSAWILRAFKAWVGDRPPLSAEKLSQADLALADSFSEAVHPKDEESVQYLADVAVQTNSKTAASLQSTASRRVVQMWEQMKPALQGTIAMKLMQASRQDERGSAAQQSSSNAAALLRSLSLSFENLNDLLSNLLPGLEVNAEPSRKKRRTAGIASDPNFQPQVNVGAAATQNLRQLSLCLELIDAPKPQPDLKLFHNLFNALQTTQTYQSSRTSAEVDFPQILILTNLLALAQCLQNSTQKITLDTSIVRVDLLIDCLRKTANAQVRNASIGILSILSQYIPEAVLHNIIPVFTLMSRTTVRQTDEYSIQIVDQAIQEVVPRLASALRKQKANIIASTEDIISSFAAAFEHIPHLRRLRLYSLLASALGPQDSLYAIIASLADRWPIGAGVAQFVPSLMRQFSFEVAFTALRNYIDLILLAVTPSSSHHHKSLFTLPEQAEERKTKLFAWLHVLASMSKDGIDAQKLRVSMTGKSSNELVQQLFGQILEKVLRLSRILHTHPRSSETCSLTLEYLLKLLSFDHFLASIGPLLEDSDENVSRSILKSLEVQLRFTKNADSATKRSALAFLPRLANIIASQEKTLAIRLNAVVCVDRICEDYGKMNVEQTFSAAEVIARCLHDSDALMRALSTHCLASMVEVLGERFVPLLQSSLQATSDCLAELLGSSEPDIRLHNAAFALAISLTDRLSYMISPNAMAGLIKHAESSALADLGDEANQNRQHFYQVVAEKVDIKTVFDTASHTWSHGMSCGSSALQELIGLLKSSVDLRPKSVVTKHARALLSTFLTFFDLHRQVALGHASRTIGEDQITSVEREIIAVQISLILKINDATFRPFFVQLVEWSTDLPHSGNQSAHHRQITLFNFLHTISERLKSLVTPYFGYVLEPAAAVLRAVELPKSGSPAHALTLSVFDALTSSFKHDQDDFYQAPSRFALLHPALLAQLPLHNPAPASSIVQTHAIPCLVAFASAVTAVPDHLTQLCTSLLSLLKGHQPAVLIPPSSNSTTHTNDDALARPKTLRWTDKRTARNGKLAAVMAMRSLTRELGEEWLGMLPQMLPVVSELLEDGDEKVEWETERWVKETEGVLGEGLGEMLA